MSFPQGPGNGNNPNPNNNRNNGNPFTNPFNRGNNGNNGKGNKENRPIWQSPWLWGAVLVVMVVLMFQMFAGGGTKTIDTKDGFALINQGKATYAEITDNKQVVRLELKNDYTKKNADTGKVTNYGKNVQFYYTFAQGAQVAKAVENGDLEKGWTSNIEQTSVMSYLITSILPFVIILALFWWLMSRMGGAGGMLGMGGKKNSGKLLEGQTPTTKFADVAGEDEAVAEVEEIKDFLKDPSKYKALGARIPRGVLLYGPPGNGKTMIAKAVAHALSDGFGRGSGVFLSVKGPELLNKFVGESERLVRQIFTRARERAADGRPVIVFIDEMDSLLRTRGTGVSSDVETTIVPQFLSELDGVESLDNVMVIGASNRVDMIDPAVLRPGRLDVKIRVDRPGADQAASIIRHYLTDDLPLQPGLDADGLSRVLVRDIYTRSSRRHLCDACNDQGQWSAIFLSDVASGAMLKNIVDRAKTKAVKASILGGDDVALNVELLGEAVEDEFVETRGSVMDVDPVQWSRINGMDNGRVVRIRPVPRKEKENMQ